ncbi:unnamed protein product [Clonostachys rhizophaga]|uniref:Uncharacterized protein n=1 Tax=Clonostachys rhizophaga TaxID=160324 RepID=A0A9N9VWI7_9HYPO|nr:unnamed protein product [Clonostachys rhizophaga]
MPQRDVLPDQPSQVIDSKLGEAQGRNEAFEDLDDDLMVYETPRNYRDEARQERDRLIAQGADPGSIILQSELHTFIPKKDNESPEDFAKRYVEQVNTMINRGIQILNDQYIADVVASVFQTADGRTFDLGPGSGATRREFREFSQWFYEASDIGQLEDVPEKILLISVRSSCATDSIETASFTEIVAFAKARNITILSDETYRPFFHNLYEEIALQEHPRIYRAKLSE